MVDTPLRDGRTASSAFHFVMRPPYDAAVAPAHARTCTFACVDIFADGIDVQAHWAKTMEYESIALTIHELKEKGPTAMAAGLETAPTRMLSTAQPFDEARTIDWCASRNDDAVIDVRGPHSDQLVESDAFPGLCPITLCCYVLCSACAHMK